MKTLREMREERGLDQATLARELGISQDEYAACEEHPGSLTISQAQELCRLLACDLDSIVWDEGRITNTTGSQNRSA